MPKREGSQV